jgi:hypothetical protein
MRIEHIDRGRSSGVEHNLAKVGVEGSNPFARSNISILSTVGSILATLTYRLVNGGALSP